MDIPNFIFAVTEEVAKHAAEESSGGVLGTLGLNWKLFVAQLINFVVVIFVLWKFAFKPIGGALEARRLKIEAAVKNAEAIQRQMQEADEERDRKLAAARGEADELIKSATAAARQIKTESVATARAEAEKIMDTTRRTIDAEREKMLQEVRAEVANLVVMASERVIKGKLDEKKDKQLVNEALSQVK